MTGSWPGPAAVFQKRRAESGAPVSIIPNRAHSWRLGVGRLDRASEARLVRGTVAEGSSDRLHRLVDAAAGSLFSGGAVANLHQVSAIAGDEGGAVASRAVARHDDSGLECLQPIEAREPLSKARMGARKGWLRAHSEIAGKQDALGIDQDDRIADRMVWAHGCEFCMHTAEIEVVVALERDVGLAEIRVLEQFGIDCGTAGENLSELQA